jgi:hypothetical protein
MRYTPTSAAPVMGVGSVSVLIKADRPRAIDRFIDYFGEPGADLCGEELLDEIDGPRSRRGRSGLNERDPRGRARRRGAGLRGPARADAAGEELTPCAHV